MIKFNEMITLASEATGNMPEEDDEDVMIKKKIKNHDRKSKAFEKETFDLFDYENETETELGNEDYSDTENTPKDIRKKMWRSCTNGFFKRQGSMATSPDAVNRSNFYDESDSVFRSSMRGFFTGKNKENKYQNNTIYGSSNSTSESNELSNLVSNNSVAFSGNPLRALKHSKKNVFSNYGSSDILEARGIEELMNDFSRSAQNFKSTINNMDVAERLKQNRQNKLKE